jgi:predicted ATP-grasp superfamily ATP-dependent carboligase
MWPPTFGNSTACVSIPLSKAKIMKKIIIDYLHSIRFHGIFSVEFKVDSRDKTAKILEVNARSWWYNSFPAECGINIIYIAYLDAIGKHVQPQEKYRSNVKLLYILQDIYSSFVMFTNHTLHPVEWISSIKGEKHYAFLAEDDMMPFLTSFPYFFQRVGPKMIKLSIQSKK